MSIVHIHTVLYKMCRATTNLVEVGRFLKDACVCPPNMAWGVGGLTTTAIKGRREGVRHPDTFCDILSFPLFVVNRKWHSSSSAFCPPPLSVFCLSCFFWFALIVMSWVSQQWLGGRAAGGMTGCMHVCLCLIYM